MTVHMVCEPPAALLGEALHNFEQQFVYPLGPGRTFQIEHGSDYARFYRAIGDGRCFVEEQGGRVRGVVAVAIRPMYLPDGRLLPVAYIGDVKVAAGPGRGAVLLRTVRQAEPWCRPRAGAAFSVVMDGTPAVPTAYTGRLGIPPFAEVGKVMVFRFGCHSSGSNVQGEQYTASEAAARECFRRLSAGRFACPPGVPAERSETGPIWLVHAGGAACGCLEDTRRAKRLVADDGTEMISAHLSGFAYRDISAGAALLRHALCRANALGFPALFVAVPALEAADVKAALSEVEVVSAPATVYAHGLDAGLPWIINSSEI
jgi:hypothetical protein